MIRVKKNLDHKKIRCLIWLVLTLFVLAGYSLQSAAGSAYYSLVMQNYATVSTPPVILQNGTAGISTIYANNTSAKVSVEAPLFDYVDNNDPDVDSNADKGMHSNFPAQQAGPESIYDTLSEENTEGIEDYVDNNTSDMDNSTDLGTHSNFENQKAQDSFYDTLTEVSQENTYSLDATGGYMIVGDGTPDWGSTTGTISFWVKMDTAVQGRFYGQDGNMETRWSGTNLVLDWGGTDSMTSAYSFLADTWYFVAIVWDENNDNLFLYVGDENNAPTLDANSLSGIWTSTTPAPTENRFLNGLGGAEPVDGHGDDLRYWNISRSLAELQSDYNQTLSGSEPNLQSYFKLDNNFDDIGPNNDVGSGSGSYSFSTDVPFSGSSDYGLDLEVQWTSVIDFLPTEKLCIYAGALGSEDLRVDYWNGTGWENLATDLTAYSCNEYDVSLTSTTFTLRFKDGTTAGDTTQDQWQIDASLLRVEGAGDKEDAVDQQSNVDGSADVGTHSNFTAQQYGPDSINDTLTEADTSASNNNNVDSEIVIHGSTTGISGAQTVDSITENMTEETLVIASYTSNEADGATSISVNKPTGTSEGDLLIIFCSIDGTGESLSNPTDFTDLLAEYQGNDITAASWYKTATASEPSSYSTSWVGTEDAVIGCFRITGWDSTDFPHKSATNTGTGQTVFPNVTTTKDDCLILRFFGMDDDDDTEPITGCPADHTELYALATNTIFAQHTGAACWRNWASADDTGTATWAHTSGEGWYSATIAIAPSEHELEIEHVVNSILNYQNYNLTIRAYRSAENFYLQMYNFTSFQWVNFSTVSASSLTWYNTTLAKADFVNSTNQARIRYWQGADATQETLYVDYSSVYGWNATNYELDLEVKWTDLHYSLPNETLCIYGATMEAEDIKVDVWNGTGWETVFTDLSSGWNNASITDWLTISNFTIRFKGGTETGDANETTWQIDVALVHVWHEGGESYELDLEVQWTGADYTRTNEELCIKTGTFSGSENIQVRVWNNTGSSWHWLMNLTASQWNNVSITSYLTSNTFTVQYLGGTETGDTNQDSWNIDATLLHVWTSQDTLDYVDNNTTDVDSSADKGTHGNFTAQEYLNGIYDTLTEADTSTPDTSDNNVDSETITHGSTTGISGAQTTDGTTENMTEGTIEKIGTDTSGTGNNLTLSFSHTLVSGTNRIVVVSIGIENGNTTDVDSVTYGGQTCTKAIDHTAISTGFRFLVEIWYILDADLPSDGSRIVNVTCSGIMYELEVNAFCSEYAGVTQGAPEATDGYNQTIGSTITNTISPSDNAWVISGVGAGNIGDWAHGEGQVEVLEFDDNSSTFAVAELRGASGETSLSSNYTGTINRLCRACASWTEAATYQLDIEHVVNSIGEYENYNLTTRAYRTAPENFYLQLYNFTSSQWVNISTITASSLTWYNTSFAKTDFVNSTNQARIRYWQDVDATQETLYVDYSGVYGWNATTNHELDLEVQWTGADYTGVNEELCIKTGTFSGSENIQVKVWNNTGSSWHWVMNLTANQWNNVSVTSYLTSSTFTVQYLGGTETGDTSEDSWNIDVSLLHVSTAGTTYDYVLRVNNTVTDSWQVRLKKYSDSNVNRLQDCTIYFHNSTDGTSNQIIIENGSYINQTGPWYDLGDSETIYIAMTVKANDAATSYVYAYLEIRTPNTTTYAQYVITFEIT